MALSTLDVKVDDSTDTGVDLYYDDITTGDVAVTKIMFGLAGANDGLVDSTTPLPVEIFDVAGTLNTDIGTIAGAVYADDADWSDGTSTHILIGGLYQSTPQTITDGDVGPLQVNANGYLLTVAAANDGVDIGDVDVASHPSDTFVAEGGALGKGVLLQGDDGTDRTNVLVDTDGHLQIDVLSGGGGTEYSVDSPLGATPTGILAIGIRDDALSSLSPIEGDAVGLRVDANGALWVITSNTDVAGDVAHDSVDSGNPVKIGAKVETATSGITLAADADRTDLFADADGVLLTRSGRPLADLLHNRTSNTDGASTAFTGDFAAAGASTKNYVTGYCLHNSSATDGYIDFRDGTAGTVLWTVPLPANGGANVVCSEPLFATSANTALAFDVSAALSTVYISVTGFKSKV